MIPVEPRMIRVNPGQLIRGNQYFIEYDTPNIPAAPSRERGTFVGYGNSYGLPLGEALGTDERHKNTIVYARFNPIATMSGNPLNRFGVPAPTNGDQYRNIHHNRFYQDTEDAVQIPQLMEQRLNIGDKPTVKALAYKVASFRGETGGRRRTKQNRRKRNKSKRRRSSSKK